MQRTIFTVAIAALFVVAVPRAQAPATPANDFPPIAFEKYTLPNGLEVILSEDHRLPLTAVVIACLLVGTLYG